MHDVVIAPSRLLCCVKLLDTMIHMKMQSFHNEVILAFLFSSPFGVVVSVDVSYK